MRPRPKNVEIQKFQLIGKIWEVEQILKIPYAHKKFSRAERKYLARCHNGSNEIWLAIAFDKKTDTYRFIRCEGKRFGNIDFSSTFRYVSTNPLNEEETTKVINGINTTNEFIKIV